MVELTKKLNKMLGIEIKLLTAFYPKQIYKYELRVRTVLIVLCRL